MPHPYVGRIVLVRSYASGVHYGTLEFCQDQTVTLTDARRLWSWQGAFTLSAVSQTGPTSARLSCAVPEIYLPDVCEVIPCSPAAVDKLNSIPEHKP